MRKRESHRKADGFINRTLLGVISILKETILNEEIASRKGFLQKCDPRFKCISIVLLIICALATNNKVELSGIYLMTLIFAMFSGIPIVLFFKRTFLFIPIFSLFIVIPAIFSVVTPGEPIITFRIFANSLSITKQGIGSAAIFFLRVLASVSLSILLVMTTRHHVLLKVLRIFKVPRLFVMTMGMTYRYIYLLLDIVQNTFIAIKSRVGYVTSSKTGRRIVTANMAGLWLKSYRMQTQVYNAMLSRGYTGEPKVIETFHAGAIDLIVLAFAITVLIGTLWLNQFMH